MWWSSESLLLSLAGNWVHDASVIRYFRSGGASKRPRKRDRGTVKAVEALHTVGAEISQNARATPRVSTVRSAGVSDLLIAHIEVYGYATVAGERCWRRCAWRPARPVRARFVAGALARRQQIMINLMRRLAMERGVRATLIVPTGKTRQLLVEGVRTKRHKNDACAFVLERQDESLDERNAPVLANGAKAGCDPLVVTPILEQVAPELRTLVADDIFRIGTRFVHGAFEKVLNRS